MFSRNEIGAQVSRPNSARHPWWKLEEFNPHGGMWKIPPTLMRDEFARRAAELMCDTDRFLAAMRSAIRQWPTSCEAAFATPGLNLRAWLGHAGCYLATGSPEETTRLGWHQLDDAEQYGANAAADQAITEYRRAHEDQGQDLLWDTDYA